MTASTVDRFDLQYERYESGCTRKRISGMSNVADKLMDAFRDIGFRNAIRQFRGQRAD